MGEESILRDEGPDGVGGLSRRRLLGVSAAAGLAVAGMGVSAARGAVVSGVVSQRGSGQLVAAPGAAAVIGVNFDNFPGIMSVAELQNVGATWVRGFYPMAGAAHGNVAGQPVIKALLSAAGQGYGTVLSLKFQYDKAPIPAAGRTQLFMGALNHLDEASWRTAATERWMDYVRGTAAIAGTDIHPHLPAPGNGSDYLNYILPRMRPDQKFLATEFSLVLDYKAHLDDTVAASFASKYHLKAGTRVYQVIQDALKSPFPQQKWTDFLAMSPWFAANKGFLTSQANQFRATGKLAVACYSLGQGAPITADKFTASSTPWLLVSMFCQRTVQRAANGLPGQITDWTSEFRALQRA
jgi:hypothetical protein